MKEWVVSILDTWRRVSAFWKNPVVVMYFICIVLIVGSLGVWLPLIDDSSQLSCQFNQVRSTLNNLSTYIISILAASMADFLLSDKERGKGLKILVFSIFLMAFLFAVVSMVIKGNQYFVWGSFALTLFFWIIVYADDNTKGARNFDPQSASGGPDPDQQSLPGTLNDFQV